jgi:hypothetical protein
VDKSKRDLRYPKWSINIYMLRATKCLIINAQLLYGRGTGETQWGGGGARGSWAGKLGVAQQAFWAPTQLKAHKRGFFSREE